MSDDRAPAFQLYARDFLADPLVDAMEPEELGGYFRLLLIAWQQEDPGHLPNDHRQLASWSRLGRRWKKHGPAILRCFREATDGRIYQKRMVQVAADLRLYREQQAARGRASGEARRRNRDATGDEPETNHRSIPVQPRFESGSNQTGTEREPEGNSASASASADLSEEALSRAGARVAEPVPKAEPVRGVMSSAWSNAGLPGVPDATDLSTLQVNLFALSLDPLEACRTWKSLLTVWREKRKVMVYKVNPAKMLEHLPFVQQVMRGEVKLDDIAAPAPSGKSGHVGFKKIDDEKHEEGDQTERLRQLVKGKA